MGQSEDVFRMTSNEMYQLPSEPSRQEEFKHIVINFILDQEERAKQLEEYMKMIITNFMQLSSEVTRGLKKIKGGGEQDEKNREDHKIPGHQVKASHLLMEFWPSIRDGGFNVGNMKVASIRDPKVKLAYWCIATTISGRKESTNRFTKIDLYYLYCIYTEGVICNIPYWLAKYIRRVREKNLIYGGMFVTRIARSFGLLTNEMRDALSVEPLPYVFKKKSLIAMRVIIELHNWVCVWPVVRADWEDDEAEEEAVGEATNEEARGSTEIYRNINQGDLQAQANWMYDNTVREFQYLSTRDNLDPHLQIDPFPWREADYPPYGYYGHMPPGYAYRPDPSHDGSS
ncbi:hypothetical protein Tco_0553031 [Tanacetum coccineum]